MMQNEISFRIIQLLGGGEEHERAQVNESLCM